MLVHKSAGNSHRVEPKSRRDPGPWQQRAACRGPHAAVFFPPSTAERREDRDTREHEAKRICQGCTVRADCLDYALTIREPHGIWGGLTELERRPLLSSYS